MGSLSGECVHLAMCSTARPQAMAVAKVYIVIKDQEGVDQQQW